MPTVPRRDPASTVDLKAHPGVQFSDGGATEETFGGGASGKAVGAAAKGISDIGMKIAIKQRKDADDVAAQSLINKATMGDANIRAEVSQLQGQNAATSIDLVKEKYAPMRENLMAEASNPYIKSKLDASLRKQFVSSYQYAQGHSVQQAQIMDKKDVAAAKVNSLNKAVAEKHNPESIADALKDQERLIVESGQRWGWTNDQIAAEFVNVTGDTKAQIINSFISEGNLEQAAAYYSEWKGELGTGPTANSIAKNMSEAVDIKSATSIVEGYRAAGLSDLEAAEQMLDLPDEKLRKEVNGIWKTYTRKRDIAYLDNTYAVAGAERNNQLTRENLVKAKDSIPKQVFEAAIDSLLPMNSSGALEGDQEKRTKKFLSLFNQYMDIQNKDVYDQARYYTEYTRDVFLAKPYIDENQYDQLLSYVTPDFVRDQAPKKSNLLASGVKAYTDYTKFIYSKMWNTTPPMLAYNGVMSLIERLSDKDTKPEEIPGLVQAHIKEDVRSRNQAAMLTEDVTNSLASQSEGLRDIYPGPSEQKPDVNIQPPQKVEQVTEEDIRYTMNKYNMTREQVLAQLGIG